MEQQYDVVYMSFVLGGVILFPTLVFIDAIIDKIQLKKWKKNM